MNHRKDLERLCKSNEITQNQAVTVNDLLRSVNDHLFSHLSHSIYQFAGDAGRKAIILALSSTAAHLELDKVFCSLNNDDVADTYDTLEWLRMRGERKNAGEDTQHTREIPVSPHTAHSSVVDDCSTTPDPAHLRTFKWIYDQKSLQSENADGPKRRHCETANLGLASSYENNLVPLSKYSHIRRQPHRSCKGGNVKQHATRRDKRNTDMRKLRCRKETSARHRVVSARLIR